MHIKVERIQNFTSAVNPSLANQISWKLDFPRIITSLPNKGIRLNILACSYEIIYQLVK